MKDEYYAKLGIFSSILKPDEIDNILNIDCDKSYLKNELRGKTLIREKENGWIIYSRISRDLPINNHIEDILERISLVIDKINDIANKPDTEVELGCIIHSTEEPPVYFTKEQISIIGKIGASIDIDLYYWQK